MTTKKPPVRLTQYANIGRVKHAKKKPSKSRRHHSRPVAWFLKKSWPKRIALIASVVLVVLVTIAVATYFAYASDIKDPERLMNRNNTGIVITDVNGKTIYSDGRAEHRNVVKLADISPYMKNALIASEDKDFYKHGGFNLLSTIRALFTGVGGGSTLTQQLAKNTILSDQHSLLRKWQELAVSVAIEQTYSKDQILEFYLNSVYFGENSFGIEDAASTYYGKAPKDLTLAESAMLVGVLPAPSAYSPISGNAEYAKQRQTTVLSRMVTNGYIKDADKTSALAEQIAYQPPKNTLGTEAPHFAQVVKNQLIEKYGEEQALRSGYQVKTTLNLDTQTIVRDAIAANMKTIQANGGSNASAIVIDPKTGEIRAYVGSADWNNEQWGKVDMVNSARQPGSSFKSIYYAAALADGDITPSSQWKDELTDFGGGYVPYNADLKWHGTVTTRSAIAMSLNIPSVKIMQQYGIQKSITAAKNLGITTLTDTNNYGLALALGSAEVPLIQMTNAYAAFANQGQQFSPSYIVSVKDKFDKEIFHSTHTSKQAINKEGAYLISSILSDNNARAPIFGSSLTVAGHAAAVKTGTTNDDRDAWTIGYTPDMVMGVWVGNNDNTAMKNGSVVMAGPIWRNAMTKMLAGTKNAEFTRPSSIVDRAVCKSNGGLASQATSATYNEVFMAGALPTNSCTAEVVKITVCNLDTNKTEQIDETNFDDKKYSKDLTKCQVSVCDLLIGQVVTIDKATYDASTSQYSTDTANCKKQDTSPVAVCDLSTSPATKVTITQSQYDQSPARYSTDLTKCTSTTN